MDHLCSLIANLTEAFRAFTLRFTTPSSVGSFEVVEHSEAAGRASHPAPHRADGSYQELEKEIPELPDFCRTLCGSLHGGQFSAEYRANRAWESGWWARFCLQGRLDKPRPFKKCDLANTSYVVLRAEGYVCPLYVHKAGEYRTIVKNFKEDTISHGFASLREAKVYCAAAGVDCPPCRINGAIRCALRRGPGALCVDLAPGRRDGGWLSGGPLYDYHEKRRWFASWCSRNRIHFSCRSSAWARSARRRSGLWSSHHYDRSCNRFRRGGQHGPCGCRFGVVDASLKVLPGLVRFEEAAVGDILFPFSQEDLSFMPDAVQLLKFSKEWIGLAGGAGSGVMNFYSADEGDPVKTPRSKAKSKAKEPSKAAQKRSNPQ